jgi:hypothetical protein
MTQSSTASGGPVSHLLSGVMTVLHRLTFTAITDGMNTLGVTMAIGLNQLFGGTLRRIRMDIGNIRAAQNPRLQGEVASAGGRWGIAVSGDVSWIGVRSDAGIPLHCFAVPLPFKGRI